VRLHLAEVGWERLGRELILPLRWTRVARRLPLSLRVCRLVVRVLRLPCWAASSCAPVRALPLPSTCQPSLRSCGGHGGCGCRVVLAEAGEGLWS
jgi:hypothetical protein